VAFGLLVTRWLPQPGWALGWPARLALGHLVGCGAMAWLTTAFAVTAGRLTVVPFYASLAILAAITWQMRGRLPERTAREGSIETARSLWQWLAMGGVVLGIVATGWALVAGRGISIDAHWNWALKAKAFYLGGSLNPIANGCCTHPNYPILIPMQSWWVYQHLHHVDDWWPQAVGFIFYLDLIALTFAICRANMAAVWAWIVTAVVANDVTQVLNASRGQADSAISAYVLASSFFLAAYLAGRGRGSKVMTLLLLAGILQTKNEGIAWATFAMVVVVVFELRRGLVVEAASTVGWLLAAAAPWTAFKLAHRLATGPEEVLASIHTMRLEVILRVKTIVITHLANFGPYSLPFFVVLCAPLIWYGWSRVSKPVLALLAAQFASYLVIYFIVADQIHQLSFMLRAISQLSPTLLCISMIAWQAYKSDPAEQATAE